MKKKLVIIAVCVIALTGIVLGTVYFATRGRTVEQYIEMPFTRLDDSCRTVVDKTDGYLAHPDMVQTESGRLIAAYPAGHGYGQILMKYSDDLGKTWSGRIDGTPASWADSQETPTLYKLNFKDGSTKLILVSGCPYWKTAGLSANGFNYSESNDDGQSWSEFKNFHSPFDCIVAMSSLTQLRENGEYVDKWMGTFHTHKFVNYKTILTFNASGEAEWTEPVPILSAHRETEKKTGMCELEIVRSPEGNELIMLARAEKRRTTSMISVSRDEGQTWSEPVELPYVLSGDRHKAEYDAETGLFLISFRQIIPERENALSARKFITRGWVGWLGSFADLISLSDADKSNDSLGSKLLLLGEDFRGGDCGYSGIVHVEDGFVAVSYGYFDAKAENPYILCTNVNLSDIFNE